MVLYYALGGGLGHLTRARRLLEHEGLAERALVLSASPAAGDPRVTGTIAVERVPQRLGRDRRAFRSWLRGALRSLEPEEVVIDSFPGGILGELCGMELPPARHVARRLRWGAYRLRLTGPLPHYEQVLVIEPLSGVHQRVLETSADRLGHLRLPPPATPLAEASLGPAGERAPIMVVHSGSPQEIAELVDYATTLRDRRARRIVVIASSCPPRLPPGARWLDLHPAFPYFAQACLIVTGGGWASTHETSPHRPRHRAIPFPRPLDDQFARLRAAGSL